MSKRGLAGFIFILTALAQAGSLTPEQIQTAESLRVHAMRGNRAYEILESLTTEVGPRLAGSPGDKAAVKWAVAKLKDLGFSNVRTQPVKVPNWVRGAAEAVIVSPYPQKLVIGALGSSVSTPKEGITAEVIAVSSLEDLQKQDPENVKGKIVFIDQRMWRSRVGAGYGAVVPIRGRGPVEAAKLGAAALLIRSVGTDDNRIYHTGMTRYQEDVPKIPAAALSNPDADLLAAQISRGKPVKLHMFMSNTHNPDVESANVIGEIVGSEKPEEIVLLGGHLDSWDVGTGAQDNGAGVAIVTEAARLIGQLNKAPKRTIRVVLFACEEMGLFGAKTYVEQYKDQIDKHVVAGVSDFGSGAIWAYSTWMDEKADPFAAQVARVLEPLGIVRSDKQAYAGGDLRPIADAGVPVMGLDHDGTYYFDIHHTENDTLDKVDRRDLNQCVAAYAAAAYLYANTDQDFGRIKP